MPPTAEPVQVLHQDADFLVVRKPPGIPTTSPGSGPSLVRWVAALDPDAPRLHPSSRLDAEVSGIVTFARTERAGHVLLHARREGRYLRRYVAICAGVPVPEQGEWRCVIAIDPRDKRRRVVVPDAGATPASRRPRLAESRYAVRGRAGALAWLDVWPRTGRTHQIRVQAAEARCSLVGDVHYGGPRRVVCEDGRVLRAGRVMLHCAEVHVTGTPEALHVVDAPPQDMRDLWAAAGGDDLAWRRPDERAGRH